MQHLRRTYKHIATHRVNYSEALNQCLNKSSLEHERPARYHGYEYCEFIKFPEAHGFSINNRFKLERYGKALGNLASAAVNDMCWLPYGNSDQHPDETDLEAMEMDQFLQAWLFFGLLRCVLRDEKPLLPRPSEDLTEGEAPHRQLCTDDLPEALKRWQDYLRQLHQRAPEDAELRCIQAIQMLGLAKRVVVTNLSEQSRSDSQSASDVESSGGDSEGNSHEQSLCLMVLGETLCASLAQIMKLCGMKIRGWEVDEHGWGRPALVSKMMKENQWCPRFQQVLRGQLGESAILLYAAVRVPGGEATQELWMHHPLEKSCSRARCGYVEAKNKAGQYETPHHGKCDQQRCREIGPDHKALRDSLMSLKKPPLEGAGSFPLLRIRYSAQGQAESVGIEEWTENTKFATISHVWSQGLGNRAGPRIRSCQLEYIRGLLVKVLGPETPPGASHLFWLDTLAIPPCLEVDGVKVDKEEMSELRRASINRIFHVFDKATHGIIIDRHVFRGNPNDDAHTIGINLLSSGWMRRLWTLQEAYVTRNLSLAFKGGETRNLDDLWRAESLSDKDTGDQKAKVTKSFNIFMTDMIRKKVFQNLMGDMRELRNKQEGRNPTHCSLLISSAWNSARYRVSPPSCLSSPGVLVVTASSQIKDVGKAEKETFALASLLNITLDSTHEDPPGYEDLAPDDPKRKERREALMKEFLCKIERHGIPSGMIFLPGERLSLPGFGWAPMTWMSSRDESYPYPLTTPWYPTDLVDPGLVVRYPGYLLRTPKQTCRQIISQKTAELGSGFEFSVSAGLFDLYQAQNFDGEPAANTVICALQNRLERDEPVKLGIILSRSRPVEFPCEIALLVEIYTPDDEVARQTRAKLGNQVGRRDSEELELLQSMLFCKIIRRLKISRVSPYRNSSANSSSDTSVLDIYGRFNGGIIGETVHERQMWCVDGYVYDDDAQIPVGDVPYRDGADDLKRLIPEHYTPTFKRSESGLSEYVRGFFNRGNGAGGAAREQDDIESEDEERPRINRSDTGLSSIFGKLKTFKRSFGRGAGGQGGKD